MEELEKLLKGISEIYNVDQKLNSDEKERIGIFYDSFQEETNDSNADIADKLLTILKDKYKVSDELLYFIQLTFLMFGQDCSNIGMASMLSGLTGISDEDAMKEIYECEYESRKNVMNNIRKERFTILKGGKE